MAGSPQMVLPALNRQTDFPVLRSMACIVPLTPCARGRRTITLQTRAERDRNAPQ
jgi:hypothetical protein